MGISNQKSSQGISFNVVGCYSVCRGHTCSRVAVVLLFIFYFLDVDHLVQLTVILLSLLIVLRCRLLLKRLESRLPESRPESLDESLFLSSCYLFSYLKNGPSMNRDIPFSLLDFPSFELGREKLLLEKKNPRKGSC